MQPHSRPRYVRQEWELEGDDGRSEGLGWPSDPTEEKKRSFFFSRRSRGVYHAGGSPPGMEPHVAMVLRVSSDSKGTPQQERVCLPFSWAGPFKPSHSPSLFFLPTPALLLATAPGVGTVKTDASVRQAGISWLMSSSPNPRARVCVGEGRGGAPFFLART